MKLKEVVYFVVGMLCLFPVK